MVKNLNMMWMIMGMFAVFTLYSCDDFYSTSLGESREYDLSKIKLTQSNLQAWKEKSVGNPKLAKALGEKIIEELKLELDSKSGAEKAAYQKAGIELAIEQAGIGTKIIEVASSDLTKISDGDKDAIQGLLNKVQKDLDDVAVAAKSITAIVGSSVSNTSNNEAPLFDSAYAKAASPSDVGMAVMVLALSLIPDIDENTNLDNLQSLIPSLAINNNKVEIDTTNGTPSDEEKVLAAYLNLITSDTTGKFNDNPITGGIKSAFGLSSTGE
jgi:hypothetical protein